MGDPGESFFKLVGNLVAGRVAEFYHGCGIFLKKRTGCRPFTQIVQSPFLIAGTCCHAHAEQGSENYEYGSGFH